MIPGNTELQASVRQMVENQTVPGVMLLIGPKGVGIELFARDIATGILGVTDAMLNRNPDFLYVSHEDEKTSVPHSLEEISEVLMRVATKSLSGNRVVIIPDADLFSASVANTLLKTLEESALGTHFILLAHQEGKLLPTIRSRSSIWHLAPVSEAVLADYFKAHATKDYFSQVLAYSVGRFEVAERLFTDTKARTAWKTDHEFLTTAIAAPAYTRIAMGEKLTPKGDHADKKALLMERLARFQVLAAVIMKEDPSRAHAWGAWIDTLQETERALLHHGSPRLHIDNLLLALPRLS